MNDKLIFSDGVSVYATFESEVTAFPKYVLLFINVLLYSGILFAIYKLPENELPNFIFPLLAVTTILFFTLSRYTLWNFFGKETVIINTKSFSYFRDYGWFRTGLKTQSIKNGFQFYDINEFTIANLVYVNILFEYYDENDLPQRLYETALRTEKKNYERLHELIDELFSSSKVVSDQDTFSLN